MEDWAQGPVLSASWLEVLEQALTPFPPAFLPKAQRHEPTWTALSTLPLQVAHLRYSVVESRS